MNATAGSSSCVCFFSECISERLRTLPHIKLALFVTRSLEIIQQPMIQLQSSSYMKKNALGHQWHFTGWNQSITIITKQIKYWHRIKSPFKKLDQKMSKTFDKQMRLALGRFSTRSRFPNPCSLWVIPVLFLGNWELLLARLIYIGYGILSSCRTIRK